MKILNPLVEKIRAEIAVQGAIPFARFMELALYCPEYGFYERDNDTVGRAGHFQTSVSVGGLFCELLAFQFAKWAELPKVHGAVALQMIEAGAHDGKLAADILGWFQSRLPESFAVLEYIIIEPSARRREWQRKNLAAFQGKVRWCDSLRDEKFEAENAGTFRIVFCNELLDAMPVHRVAWDAKRRDWFEWGVVLDGGRLKWAKFAPAHLKPAAPDELLAVLPDGFTTEICPAAEAWWREAAGIIRFGKLLALDYGLAAEEFFAPHRASGTLRGYHKHRYADDLLALPGEQDITAHVNLTAIERAGVAVGLKTEQFTSQAQFFTSIAGLAWQRPESFGEWTPASTRQFQTLTHPDHLGRAFKVLVQGR